MADILITEFMDETPLAAFSDRYSVHLDTGLWNKPDDLERQVAGAKGLIVRNRTRVTAAVIGKAAKLRVIGRLGVGLDNIDLAACKARGIVVCPATGANAVSVAEYVLATTLLLARFPAYMGSAALVGGGWPREAAGNGREIAGLRLGLIGFGSIGQTVAAKARAFGLAVAAFDDFVPTSSAAWKGIERLDLDALLAQSDVVSLHCPLTPETRNLIDARRLKAMKRGAYLIDTARGGIVDEAALADALKTGQLGGAALDVFETEPIDKASGARFAGVPNLILTPHIAGVTRDSNDRISAITVQNVLKVLEAR